MKKINDMDCCLVVTGGWERFATVIFFHLAGNAGLTLAAFSRAFLLWSQSWVTSGAEFAAILIAESLCLSLTGKLADVSVSTH